MDVKSTFLKGELKGEVYIEQPKGFKLKDDSNIVFQIEEDPVWIETSSSSLV